MGSSLGCAKIGVESGRVLRREIKLEVSVGLGSLSCESLAYNIVVICWVPVLISEAHGQKDCDCVMEDNHSFVFIL